MKKITINIIAITFVFCLSGFAQASLIDDQVDVYHRSPLLSILDEASGGDTVTVETGANDAITLHYGVYLVDIEESSVIVDFLRTNQFGNPGVFDYAGLVLSDLDFEPGYMLLGVDVDTNMAGWDESRLMFGEDFVGFNWQGLAVDDGTNFTALLDFGPSPIPLPPTLLLFATGIAGFTFFRRKITK
jgi:hypothetical protein